MLPRYVCVHPFIKGCLTRTCERRTSKKKTIHFVGSPSDSEFLVFVKVTRKKGS